MCSKFHAQAINLSQPQDSKRNVPGQPAPRRSPAAPGVKQSDSAAGTRPETPKPLKNWQKEHGPEYRRPPFLAAGMILDSPEHPAVSGRPWANRWPVRSGAPPGTQDAAISAGRQPGATRRLPAQAAASTRRRARTAAASCSRTATLSSQPMQASVTLWPRVRGLSGARS